MSMHDIPIHFGQGAAPAGMPAAGHETEMDAVVALFTEALRPMVESGDFGADAPGTQLPAGGPAVPQAPPPPPETAGLLDAVRARAACASRAEDLARSFPGTAAAEAQLPEALGSMTADPAQAPAHMHPLQASQAAQAAPAQTAPHFYFLPGHVVAASPLSGMPFDVQAVRRDFPALNQRVHGKPLIWFDNAATTQKPRSVIDAVSRFYEHDNSNIHRAAHTLAARATEAYEEARRKVQQFLGAASPDEIVFVRGTTEGINLVAQTLGRARVGQGDEIVLTTLEHHSNIVPWQLLAREKCAQLRVVPITDSGEVLLEDVAKAIGPKTRIVAVAHVSNVLGTVLPIREIAELAHRHGAAVLVDGAQAVAHVPVNVRDLGADFYVLSGHKLFAPTGIGALYAREELLREMPVWQGGGNMIRDVTFEETTYSDPPAKFEAGTGTMSDAVGLGAAIDYISRIGLQNMAAYEGGLTSYGMERIAAIPGTRMIGTAPDKVGVLSFVMDGMRPDEIGRMLDMEGIAVRAGHHCAQPAHARYGLASTVRPSLAFYNTREEIDVLVEALQRIRRG